MRAGVASDWEDVSSGREEEGAFDCDEFAISELAERSEFFPEMTAHTMMNTRTTAKTMPNVPKNFFFFIVIVSFYVTKT